MEFWTGIIPTGAASGSTTHQRGSIFAGMRSTCKQYLRKFETSATLQLSPQAIGRRGVIPSDAAIMEPQEITPSQASKLAEIGSFHTNQEIILTSMLLGFALLSLLFLYLCVRTGHSNQFFLRIYVITIIIFGTLLVVSSAYTTEQIAPIVGLFGTIAGYVLGRSERSDRQQKD